LACASGCGSSGFLQAPGRSRPLKTSPKTFRSCCSTAWPLRRSQPRRTKPSHRDSKPCFGFPAETPAFPPAPAAREHSSFSLSALVLSFLLSLPCIIPIGRSRGEQDPVPLDLCELLLHLTVKLLHLLPQRRGHPAAGQQPVRVPGGGGRPGPGEGVADP